MAFHDLARGRDLHEPSRIRVQNKTGSSIPSGTWINIAKDQNSEGNIEIVALASPGSRDIAFCDFTLDNDVIGTAVTIGRLRNIDTSSFTTGQYLKLASSTTYQVSEVGDATIARVVVSDSTNGVLNIDTITVDINDVGSGDTGTSGITGFIQGYKSQSNASSDGDVFNIVSGTVQSNIEFFTPIHYLKIDETMFNNDTSIFSLSNELISVLENGFYRMNTGILAVNFRSTSNVTVDTTVRLYLAVTRSGSTQRLIELSEVTGTGNGGVFAGSNSISNTSFYGELQANDTIGFVASIVSSQSFTLQSSESIVTQNAYTQYAALTLIERVNVV